MDFTKEFNSKNHYKYAFMIAFLSVILGILLQILWGSIPKNWFSFPNNIIGGLLFVFLNTAVFFAFQKKNFISLHSSTPFAIVTVAVLGILTIGLGSIQISAMHNPFLAKLGFDDITKSWYFALVFLMALTNLWFAILKKSIVFQKKNIVFLLNHFGLWLVMFSGVLGQGDLIRLKMDLKKDKVEWRATDDYGNITELPIALELKEFKVDIFANKLFIIDKEGNALPKKKPDGFMLDKEGTSKQMQDWKITLHQYIENAAPSSDTTYMAHNLWGATNAAFVSVENIKTGQKKRDWIACGNFQLPPRAITLDENYTLVMSPPEAKRFESEVVVYQKDIETPRYEKIQVNHPIKVQGWNIYQVSYDEKMGRWSDTSVVELILDPWLPIVYTGIFILIAGCVGFLFTSRK